MPAALDLALKGYLIHVRGEEPKRYITRHLHPCRRDGPGHNRLDQNDLLVVSVDNIVTYPNPVVPVTMTLNYPELLIPSIISFVAVAYVVPWHIRIRNIATLSMSFWMLSLNMVHIINRKNGRRRKTWVIVRLTGVSFPLISIDMEL
jgi:hypothetical protein